MHNLKIASIDHYLKSAVEKQRTLWTILWVFSFLDVIIILKRKLSSLDKFFIILTLPKQ